MKISTQLNQFTTKLKIQFSTLLLLSFLSLVFLSTAQAQGNPNTTNVGDCAGKFSVTATKTYDAVNNKTIYTYTVTEVSKQHNLSHFGFQLKYVKEKNLSITNVLNGAVARYSTVSATGPGTLPA
jgi:hypothetical protein